MSLSSNLACASCAATSPTLFGAEELFGSAAGTAAIAGADGAVRRRQVRRGPALSKTNERAT